MTAPTERVAVFLYNFAGGGAERVLLTVAHQLEGEGIGVDVVAAQSVGPLVREAEGLTVHELGAHSMFGALLGLVSYLRRRRPGVLLSSLRHANVLVLLARAAARVPTRVVIREANTASVLAALARSRRSRLIPFLMRVVYPRADGIIAVSEGVATDLVSHVGVSREAIEVIHNPTVTPDLERKSREPVDPRIAQLKAIGHRLVLGVGRLVEQKDFATLIRAFARASTRLEPSTLVLLGEGPERRALEQLARELGVEERVVFLGFVANPFSYMAAADVFVLTSRCEGLPNVLIQALACGCPVVSTDCPSGPREILQDGRVGRLVPMGAVEAVAEAMLEAVRVPVPPNRLQARARDFAVEQVMPRYVEYLRARLPRAD